MRIFLAGGTGKIGSRLLPHLKERGDEVILLTRNKSKAENEVGTDYQIVEGDPTQTGNWMDHISGCDGVINLVGEDVFGQRWTEEYKQRLRESRLLSSQNIVQAIRDAADKPKVYIQGSAIGYYGARGDEFVNESSPPGDDMLAKLCVEWEQSAQPVEVAGVRLVLLRTGVVLDDQGGALQQMMKVFRWGVGGKVSSGKQWVSWIHYQDEAGLILFSLDNDEVSGPLNCTAPNPVTNRQLTKALGKAMRRPTVFPVPGFMLRLMYGEVAYLLTTGQRVMPEQALQKGYEFQYPELQPALQHLVRGVESKQAS